MLGRKKKDREDHASHENECFQRVAEFGEDGRAVLVERGGIEIREYGMEYAERGFNAGGSEENPGKAYKKENANRFCEFYAAAVFGKCFVGGG